MQKHRRHQLIRTIGADDIPALIDEFLLSRRAEGRSPRTIDDYRRKLTIWHRWLQTTSVRPVDPFGAEAVKQYSLHLLDETNLERVSVHGYLATLRAFCSWLVEEGEIAEHPFCALKLPKVPKRQPKPFSRDELRAMVDACRRNDEHGTRDMAVILVLLDTGMRVSELCGVRLADWEGNRIRVVGKGDKERFCFLSPTTQRALSRYVRRGRPDVDNDRLFISSLTDEGLTDWGIRQIVERVAQAAGIEGAHPHKFRHTFAIESLRGGMDSLIVQQALGHESLEMTRRYAAVANQDVERAHEKASPVARLGIRFRDRKGRG